MLAACGTQPTPSAATDGSTGGGSTPAESSDSTPALDIGADPDDGSSGMMPPTPCPASGFYVEDGRLHDSNCNEFILRGINYPYAWFSWRDDTAEQFAHIAATGANAVRVVLTNGVQWDRVTGEALTQVIGWARDSALVAVLEIHDATGWPEQGGAADPETAVDYWLSPDVRAAIDGNEAFVIINIANEPLGNTATGQWAPFHSAAVGQLRAAGLTHTLMVDGPNWGQDWSGTMRSGVDAQEIFDADPNANVVFSVHMYDVYGTDRSVQDYLGDFVSTGLPLVVGEFAADHGPDAPVAAQAVLSTCEAMGVGYLGWSWSGNSAPLTSLDITIDFDGDTLTPWGELLVNGPDGLSATGQPCSCYDR